MKLKTFIIAFLTFTWACSLFNGKESQKKPIARVYNTYLYKSDITDLIPDNTSQQDSISFVKSYIDNWIRQQLILHQAKLNLDDISQYADIKKQLQDYHISLIIYAYQKELVKQKLDTVITDKEIEDYYNNNPDNIKLKDYQTKSHTLPLSIKKENIRNIILNQRKLKLIKEMEQSIFQEALANNDFEIY